MVHRLMEFSAFPGLPAALDFLRLSAQFLKTFVLLLNHLKLNYNANSFPYPNPLNLLAS
jgi:hypothetical protein